ncbi:MAG: hydrolase [Myxococcales bacterium 68-20]|nr:HAD family hydrolase [Myxococcales bacterium]OJY25233.1 MAG: hydrolase [Myxococcales bacterium 68-20]
MARIRAVLFDIDGTLLDSNDAHAHAWLDSLRGHGRNVPFEKLRSKIGMGGDKLLSEIAAIDHASVEGISISERRGMIFKAHYLPDLGPFHGARVLVDRLRSRGLVCAAVSSASASDIADLLRAAGVADLIDVVVSRDDADQSKPSPDLIEIALDRVDVTAAEALLIGDSPYDVEAGERAGVPVVALRCGGWSDSDLAGAIAIYDDPAALSSELDRSPLALDRESEPPSLRRTRTRRVAV